MHGAHSLLLKHQKPCFFSRQTFTKNEETVEASFHTPPQGRQHQQNMG